MRLKDELIRDLWYADDGILATRDASEGSEMITVFAGVAEEQADMQVGGCFKDRGYAYWCTC